MTKRNVVNAVNTSAKNTRHLVLEPKSVIYGTVALNRLFYNRLSDVSKSNIYFSEEKNIKENKEYLNDVENTQKITVHRNLVPTKFETTIIEKT